MNKIMNNINYITKKYNKVIPLNLTYLYYKKIIKIKKIKKINIKIKINIIKKYKKKLVKKKIIIY